MAGNPIASLFAQLGFRVDRTGLKAFQKDLQTTAKKIDSSSKKSVGGATDSARQKQSKFFKEITANYSKVRPNLMQMQRDLKRIEGAFVQNRITHKEYMEARRRVTEQIGKLEKQKEAAHQRALKETANEQKRLDKQTEVSNKKQQTALSRIEKTYDKHRFQLKQVRNDYKFIQQQWRSGNITLEQRERQLNQLIVKYRQLQAAQAGAAQGRGGAFAGGADPRQVGNHRIISAIHSDIGLGAMVGGFAAAQSVRAFQGFVAMEQGLTAATGSAERAGEEMEFLIGLSQKLGLFVGDLGQSFSSFAAAARGSSLSAKEVRDTFEGVASQARVLNLSAADTEGVMRSLVQMMNKGQIMAEELKNQMAERLPGSMQAAARAAHNLGITQDATTQSLFKAMEAGELMAEEFLPELSKELMKSANEGGALENAMKSTGAAIGRFQTNVFLANKTFNEAGFDKGIRNLMNTMSDFINRSDILWKMLGSTAGFLANALGAPFELIGAIADRLSFLGDVSLETESQLKLLGIALASLFKWSRKILVAFLLIPAALSGVSKLIDGEMLTWQEWALTLGGIAASLPIILKALRGIKNLGGAAGAMMPKGSAGAGAKTTPTVSDEAKRAAQEAARKGSDWQSGRGTIWNRAIESAKEAARKGAKGGPGFLPIGAGSVLPEEEFVRRQQDVPWWDLIGKIEQRQQEMNQQAIISGDVTFNINGDNSTEIADEVLRTIQNMHRQASINEPSQEK